MQIVAWCPPTTAKGAYMPTATVGTYAPPVDFPRLQGHKSTDCTNQDRGFSLLPYRAEKPTEIMSSWLSPCLL